MDHTVFIVSEGLQAPPTVGFHIHLLSIAHALAPHVNVRALVWAPQRGTEDWTRWVDSLPNSVEPDSYLRLIAPGPREGSTLARKLRCWRRAQELIEAEAKPGDVLWMRELPTALFGIPALTRWMKGRRHLRYVYDVASIVELEMGLASGVRFRGPKIGVERWLRPRFDLVRTLGHAMADILAESGVPRDKILVAPVGAHRPIVLREPRARLQRMLYIGSAEQWQGLDVLLEAMRTLKGVCPQVRLSVVGVAPETLASKNPSDNVDAIGWVSRDRIPELYREHDLFVIPRPKTPLTDTVIPMKSVEALVHRIPILASRLRAIEEITGAQAAVYFEPGSAQSLATAVSELAKEPQRLIALAKGADERAHRFEWSTIGEEIAGALFGGHD